MIHFDLPKQKSSIIKVLGVGGGGSNAVNFMYAQNIEGTDFIICNTDAKALEQSEVPNKVQLGPHLTQGLGAGANPEVGRNATEESLEEIKRILEVNTKMAFICAGMGGGTGTGGAPIIAQVCRDMNILTVGIVTTPFGFEGPRRLLQAEEGIKRLQPYVDTLLIISNDKLRMQYGNLKMKEAFSKADNVLATAAKCITDIINSRGHIIVDFADVCTVMKNGGVAILGSSAVEGENRAQKAIEEALNSPLLNDNDIRGAKWILININSAEGEFECTMDELEIINSYLRMQAGEATDVIVGMGYDPSLERKIGITLIATGFEQKDPVAALHRETMPAKKMEKPKEEKIILTLDVEGQKKAETPKPQPVQEKDVYAPTLSEPVNEAPVVVPSPVLDVKDETPLHFELEIPETKTEEVKPVAEEKEEAEETPSILNMLYEEKHAEEPKPSTSFLNKPASIYAQPNETRAEAKKEEPKKEEVKKPKQQPLFEEETIEFDVVIKDETPVKSTPAAVFNLPANDEEEEQKRRAEERIHKLRNLSYNMNSMDGNNEYENVPAYVRRNLELFGNNKLTTVEDFYSKVAVKKDDNNNTQISTINTFLDGKKPD
ncbi:cell division protein FtsZ [Parafilimonas terrae]|uniref:Cell division protein FtsZ n=1 Tax=Parafilimonas terrae TaxID=1465490 RepID=A0A1I5Z9I1_9BACT|nr:cell division protein FtsZ [Parafilimonas terrae]SFQ53129.1 cell division protein FtsZ [Parafilimonas terrae]